LIRTKSNATGLLIIRDDEDHCPAKIVKERTNFMKKQKAWIKTNTGKSRKTLSEFEKQRIIADCQKLVEQFKTQFINSFDHLS